MKKNVKNPVGRPGMKVAVIDNTNVRAVKICDSQTEAAEHIGCEQAHIALFLDRKCGPIYNQFTIVEIA